MKKATQSALTKTRKRYTAAKKKVTAALRAAKKRAYKEQNDQIKKLPSNQRKAARAKARNALKSKLDLLLKKLKPSKSYNNISSLNSAIAQVNKVKW